jgi:hypothetical protein
VVAQEERNPFREKSGKVVSCTLHMNTPGTTYDSPIPMGRINSSSSPDHREEKKHR